MPALTLLTPRDLEILTALDRTPLTAEQLLKLSRTFPRPFGSDRMVRERLQSLVAARWVRCAHYATASSGASPKYYFLSRTGFHVLYGEAAEPPTKRLFSPLGIARHHHSRALADFVTHTLVAAHQAGVAFTTFYRENTLRISIGDECLYPDCSFQLLLPDGRAFNYLVELDNGTERICSQHDTDSWDRKLRLYNRLQELADERFRVLVVATRSPLRLRHILAWAATVTPNPLRTLVCGVGLAEYLSHDCPLHTACFRNHWEQPVSLLPDYLHHHNAEVPATPNSWPQQAERATVENLSCV